MFEGLLADWQKPEKPDELNPNYGVTNQQVYNARMGTLTNAGLTLLAAAQRMSPDQRAQVLGQLANAPKQFQEQISQQMQNRLLGAKMAALDEETARKKQFKDLLADPEAFKAATGLDASAIAGLDYDTAQSVMKDVAVKRAVPNYTYQDLNDRVAVIDPRTNQIVGYMPKGMSPSQVAEDERAQARFKNETTSITLADGRVIRVPVNTNAEPSIVTLNGQPVQGKLSNFQQKYEAALRATGGNELLASKIATGVIEAVDNGLGGVTLVDKVTGQKISAGPSPSEALGLTQPGAQPTPPAAPPAMPGAMPGPAPGVQPMPSVPMPTPVEQPGLLGPAPTAPTPAPTAPAAEANPYPFASIDPNLNYGRGFGIGGVTNQAIQKAQDFFQGRMTETQAENALANKAYEQVRGELLGVLSQDLPGKNLKMTQQRISGQLPENARLFNGPSEAKKSLEAVLTTVNSDIGDLETVISSPGYAPEQRQKAGMVLMGLRRSRDNLRIMIDNMAGRIGNAPSARTPTRAEIEAELARRQAASSGR